MRFVVVGGGVAGVCCAEELCRLRPEDDVVLVSADRVLKGVSVVARLSRTLEELALVERRLDELPWPNLRLVQGVAAGLGSTDAGGQGRALLLADGRRLPFDKLCVCTGARPRELAPAVFAPRLPPGLAGAAAQAEAARQLGAMRRRVLTIRDTDSVARLAAQLAGARHVAVVGNGGIALELIAGLRAVDVTWVMRHAHIGDAFFDLDAAQFLLGELQARREAHQAQQCGTQQAEPQQQEQQGQWEEGGLEAQTVPQNPQQQRQPRHEDQSQDSGRPRSSTDEAAAGGARVVLGHAVGPRWVQQLPAAAGGARWGRVDLQYGCEVSHIELALPADGQQPQGDGSAPAQAGEPAVGQGALLLTLSGGRQVAADLVLLAIGVAPELGWVPLSIERGPDGGLAVNRRMQTSEGAVYAAGDAASCAWPAVESAHWFQMRLWGQARAMGLYAAHCMAGVDEQTGAGMAFELFTHATRFLGRKVLLLGLYNGQRLQGEPAEDMVSYSRVTEGPERTFVRLLLLRGRLQGAVLIGETDLEETAENLILDQLDVGQFGPHLLDPEYELDHVFD